MQREVPARAQLGLQELLPLEQRTSRRVLELPEGDHVASKLEARHLQHLKYGVGVRRNPQLFAEVFERLLHDAYELVLVEAAALALVLLVVKQIKFVTQGKRKI